MGTIDLVTEIPGPRSRAILERKVRVVCNPLDIHAPAVIAEALGAAFTDADGNTLLDFSGGLGCHLVGYSHPKVVEAVQRQAARFSHTDFSVIPYEVYVELAERLVRLTGGGDRKVALFNAGAEAVENAVKFAKAFTGRNALICFEGAFHGRTLLTMSLTSRHRPYKTGFGPFAPEVYRFPFPYPYRSAHPDEAGRMSLEALERGFTTMVDPQTVAAAIVEPIQGEGGFVVPTPDFLSGLKDLCARHGILVIADEIQSGTGRTGMFLASEHFDFEPDVVCLAKSLASGYPLSAVVARAEIMDAPGPSAIGGTYVGNPVACARGGRQDHPVELGAHRGGRPRGGRGPRGRSHDRGRVRRGPGDPGAERRVRRGPHAGGHGPRGGHRVVRAVPQRAPASGAARDHRRAAGGGPRHPGRERRGSPPAPRPDGCRRRRLTAARGATPVRTE